MCFFVIQIPSNATNGRKLGGGVLLVYSISLAVRRIVGVWGCGVEDRYPVEGDGIGLESDKEKQRSCQRLHVPEKGRCPGNVAH